MDSQLRAARNALFQEVNTAYSLQDPTFNSDSILAQITLRYAQPARAPGRWKQGKQQSTDPVNQSVAFYARAEMPTTGWRIRSKTRRLCLLPPLANPSTEEAAYRSPL